jgi:hypothetical protein
MGGKPSIHPAIFDRSIQTTMLPNIDEEHGASADIVA